MSSRIISVVVRIDTYLNVKTASYRRFFSVESSEVPTFFKYLTVIDLRTIVGHDLVKKGIFKLSKNI